MGARALNHNTSELAEVLKNIPEGAIEKALEETKNADKRERLLTKKRMIFFSMFMAFYPNKSYQEIFRILGESRKNQLGPLHEVDIPATSSIVEARQRLGVETMERLSKAVLGPIAMCPGVKGVFFGKWRIVSIDGTVQNVPDTAANAEYFPRSKSQHGDGAYPQIRCVALVECGTRAVIDFVLSTKKLRSEQALAMQLLPRVNSEYLLLADRLYCDGKKWSLVVNTGAKAIFRAKADTYLPVQERLSDGSYHSELVEGDRRKSSSVLHQVRVIEFRITRRGKSEIIRLITNLTERQASPAEIIDLYRKRWRWETLAKELKYTLKQRGNILRSNTPDLVKQEFIGMLLAHHTVKVHMHAAALRKRIDLDRLSYKHSLAVVNRRVLQVGAFPP
jgi:hypothetical protein